MNVVYSISGNYHDYIIPSVKSLVEHNPDVNLFIITETDEVLGLPYDAKVINVSNQKLISKHSINYYNRFTYLNLLKVYYPTLLPVDKVLHLDADTIVCENLDLLDALYMGDNWVAAVPEIQTWYRPFGDRYYNMGVALINLEQMRKDNIEKVMGKYLSDIKQPFADQDAWNKYGIEYGKFIEIPNRYNSSIACGYVWDDPAIVHLCGYSDWWNNPNIPQQEYVERYKE